MRERVFIAWGGNQKLAKKIGDVLLDYDFDTCVGGGTPEQIIIGAQIIDQIKKSSHAIILVENISKDNTVTYSQNLMFEWGFIISRFQPQDIYVYLIDVNSKDLPSDLLGSWAYEIKRDGRDDDAIAEVICEMFNENFVKPKVYNKLDLLNQWEEIKHIIKNYHREPKCSNIQIAHYILHNMQSAYYYMENSQMSQLIDNFKYDINDDVIGKTLQIVSCANILIIDTAYLTKELDYNKFFEIKTILEDDFDFSKIDNDLDQWLKFFCKDYLSLAYMFVAKNKDLTDDEKKYYLSKALQSSHDCLEQLDFLVELNPDDSAYAKLYQAYMYRNISLLQIEMGNNSNVKEYLSKSTQSRKQFLTVFKQKYSQNVILTERFSQEYYLALIEEVKHTNDVIEKKSIIKLLENYLSSMEKTQSKRHMLIETLKNEFETIKKS